MWLCFVDGIAAKCWRVFTLSLLQEVIWTVNMCMFGLKRCSFPPGVYIYLHSIDWGYWRLCCHTCVWLVQIRPDWIGNGCVAYCISPVSYSLPWSLHSCILQTMNKETRGNCVRVLRSQYCNLKQRTKISEQLSTWHNIGSSIDRVFIMSLQDDLSPSLWG